MNHLEPGDYYQLKIAKPNMVLNLHYTGSHFNLSGQFYTSVDNTDDLDTALAEALNKVSKELYHKAG